MKNKSIDIILIISIASLLALWTVTVGELIGPDTCQHAITGIFISDFLKDLVFLKSFKEMWNYTWTYYAHYPAIGLLHWPPLFHFVEGLYFLFVNISEPAARFLIYLFFILGAVYYYLLMLSLFNRNIALLSSILFISSPLVITFSRMVSLEVPSLSLCLIAIYFFHEYLQNSHTRDGVFASVFTALALLTKQTSVFLVLFYLMYYASLVFSREKPKVANFRQLIIFVGITAILIVPYYLVAFYFHGGTITKDVFQGTVYQNPYLSLSNYLFYILSIKTQLSIITIVLIVMFLIMYTFRYHKLIYSTNFLLLWALSCYVTFTLVAQKDERYIIYWIPALTGLAAIGLNELLNVINNKYKFNLNQVNFLIIALIALIVIIQGLSIRQPFTDGYDHIAKYVMSKIPGKKNEIIFYDGNDHGNMTFSLRKHDTQRNLFLFRSSKYLYATKIYSEYETGSIRNKKTEIINFFKQYGIRYVVLSFTAEDHLPAVKLLRQLVLEDENFILLKEFFVINGEYGSGYISVYYYTGAPPLAPGTELEIPMPTLGKTIRIRLN